MRRLWADNIFFMSVSEIFPSHPFTLSKFSAEGIPLKKCINFYLSVGSPISTDVRPREGRGAKSLESFLRLVVKRKFVQNVNRMSKNIMSVCQHVNLSICE